MPLYWRVVVPLSKAPSAPVGLRRTRFSSRFSAPDNTAASAPDRKFGRARVREVSGWFNVHARGKGGGRASRPIRNMGLSQRHFQPGRKRMANAAWGRK